MLTTFAALIMPLIVLFMAIVINTGHIVDSKIKLQIAADRAAYAGAAKQAHVMNKMAEKNWEVHQRFEKLKRDIVPNTNKDEEDLKTKVQNADAEITNMVNAMQEWNSKAMAWSYDVSNSVLQANYGRATQNRYGVGQDMFELLTEYETGQHQKLKSDFNILEGGLIYEPKTTEDVINIILSYVIKNPDTHVQWESDVSAPIPSGFLTSVLNRHFPQGMKFTATSLAQPHGGSIRDCAFKEKKEDCAQYQVSFVPIGGDYAH